MVIDHHYSALRMTELAAGTDSHAQEHVDQVPALDLHPTCCPHKNPAAGQGSNQPQPVEQDERRGDAFSVLLASDGPSGVQHANSISIPSSFFANDGRVSVAV